MVKGKIHVVQIGDHLMTINLAPFQNCKLNSGRFFCISSSNLNDISHRFGDQLVRIVFLNPSWFIKYSLEKAEHPLFR